LCITILPGLFLTASTGDLSRVSRSNSEKVREKQAQNGVKKEQKGLKNYLKKAQKRPKQA
jgi:hypothetical protein